MSIWFLYLFQELPTCIFKIVFSKIVKYLEQLGVYYKVPQDSRS